MNYSEISLDSSDSDSDTPKQSKEEFFYYFHKILADDSYTLAKQMQEYIETFHIQYKSIQDASALLPQPMDGMI
jgi:hypothetical protein